MIRKKYAELDNCKLHIEHCKLESILLITVGTEICNLQFKWTITTPLASRLRN